MSIVLHTELKKNEAMFLKYRNGYTKEKLLETKKKIMTLQSIGSRK
jgi:hypothetical protein